MTARTGTRVRGEICESERKNKPSPAIANGKRALASTEVWSAPNDEVSSAAATSVTAAAPMNRRATAVATDEEAGRFAISTGDST